MIEPMGDHVEVYSRLGNGQTMVIKASVDEPVEVGATVHVSLDAAGVSLFAPGPNGVNVCAISNGAGDGVR